MEQEYLAGGKKFEKYSEALVQISCYLHFGDEGLVIPDSIANSLRNDLETGDRLGKIRAALACKELAYLNGGPVDMKTTEADLRQCFQLILQGISGMLDSSDWPSSIAACWALACIGRSNLSTTLPEPEMISLLYRIWRQQKSKKLGRYPAWALSAQQLLPRDTFSKDIWGDCDLFLRQITNENFQLKEELLAALVIGWYRRAPWSDIELVMQLGKLFRSYSDPIKPTIRELLENLGPAGRQVIDEWERKQAEREAALNEQDAK
ncbi:MAG: hypothetical protein WBV94_31795 [Blastocatellia bacterium]